MDFLDEENKAGKMPITTATFYWWIIVLSIIMFSVFSILTILISLTMFWVINGNFVSNVQVVQINGSSNVSLYPFSGCPMNSYRLVVGNNATCISADDIDILYDNITAIYSIIDPSRTLSFSIQGNTSTNTVLQTSQTVNRTVVLPDFDGTLLVQQVGTGFVFIGQSTQDHGSNAGLQLSSLTANRAQARFSQYGANTGTPGISTFKSRDPTIGGTTSVIVGDSIGGFTAVGVTPTGTIPLSGLFNFRVTSATAGNNWIGTAFEVSLVSDEGPINGRRVVFNINSYGWPQWMESTSTNPQPAPKTPPSGVAVLDANGNAMILCHVISANARIQVTVQPGQAPVGIAWVSNITPLTSFNISSTAAGTDAGVTVHYFIITPL